MNIAGYRFNHYNTLSNIITDEINCSNLLLIYNTHISILAFIYLAIDSPNYPIILLTTALLVVEVTSIVVVLGRVVKVVVIHIVQLIQ